jgi:hypothetical protein
VQYFSKETDPIRKYVAISRVVDQTLAAHTFIFKEQKGNILG